MTRAAWAERKVRRVAWTNPGFDPQVRADNAAKLLLAEHRRAVRVVKDEIKRVKLNQYQYGAHEKAYILTALDNVLATLQKGRT